MGWTELVLKIKYEELTIITRDVNSFDFSFNDNSSKE